MRKTIFAFLVFVIFAVGTMLPVFAAAPSYVFYCSQQTKETGVAQTKEITLMYSVKDFQNFANQSDGGKNGINTIKIVLDYDQNVFEPIEINTTNEGMYNGIATTTKDGEKAIKALGNWGGLTYNPETKRIVADVGQTDKFVNFEDLVLQITLKVKATAAVGSTTITLKEIEASDQVKEIKPTGESVSKTVEIIKAIGDATDADPANGFGGYIRILPDMKVSEFKAIKTELDGVMKNTQGTSLSDEDYIPTGATIMGGELSYTIIAVGDLNSDGKLTVTDLSQMKAYFVGLLSTLTDHQKRACDIKWDAKFNITDLSQIRPLLVGFADPKFYEWRGTGNATCVPVVK